VLTIRAEPKVGEKNKAKKNKIEKKELQVSSERSDHYGGLAFSVDGRQRWFCKK